MIFAGILAPIEEPLEWLFVNIHTELGLTWAWSIIAITAIVRIAILPLGIKQTRSSISMQRLQPYMKQLQQKYKNDRQELNVKLMEFYRDNKVNPLASCFPLLVQLPVFLGLFFVLKDFDPPAGTSDDFSFLFGFVNDIQTHIGDSAAGWALLVFYIASQMLSFWVVSQSPDPKQRIIFLVLPLVIAPFILRFPIGLILYWITTNLWTLFQHLLVVRVTNVNTPIILPEDSKGRKKEITPKADKQGPHNKSTSAAKPPSGQPRRNKKRKR